MNAGLELDRLIAERVMGWSKVVRCDMQAGILWGSHIVTFPEGGSVRVSECVPPYSTNLFAAWVVLEKCMNDGLACSITPIPREDGEPPNSHPYLVTIGEATAQTATVEHGICQAAADEYTPGPRSRVVVTVPSHVKVINVPAHQ